MVFLDLSGRPWVEFRWRDWSLNSIDQKEVTAKSLTLLVGVIFASRHSFRKCAVPIWVYIFTDCCAFLHIYICLPLEIIFRILSAPFTWHTPSHTHTRTEAFITKFNDVTVNCLCITKTFSHSIRNPTWFLSESTFPPISRQHSLTFYSFRFLNLREMRNIKHHLSELYLSIIQTYYSYIQIHVIQLNFQVNTIKLKFA